MNLYNKILTTIFIIVSFFLIGLSIKNIHSISSVVTDDNIYQDLPNKIFVNAPIKARKKLGIENNKEQFENMFIKRGSILLAIDNKKIYSLDSVFLYIKNSDKRVHNLDFFVIKNDEKSIGKRYSFEVKKSDIFDSSFINLESAVIISYVLDAGTSYNAGLKVGDIITKVNGQNFKSIEVTVIENELKIIKHSGVNFDNNANVTIVVTYTNLEGIDGTGNSHIVFLKPFNGDELEIELTGSSTLKGEIATRKLDADLAGTSLIDIVGSANEYELDLNGGSVAKSFNFIVESFDGDFNGGSSAELTINKNIELEATGGSQLNFKGNATVLDQKLTGGSTINKK